MAGARIVSGRHRESSLPDLILRFQTLTQARFKRGGRAANERAELVAVIKQAAFGRADIGIREQFRKAFRQARARERRGEIRLAQILIRDRFAGLFT